MASLEIPVLDSDRLRLEPLSASHSQGMFELWREPAVCEHSGLATDADGRSISLPASSSRESDRLLGFWLERARAGTGFRWAVMLAERSEFVGAAGFNTLGSCYEYAYHFVPRHWGAGLAGEAAQLALAWSFARGAEAAEVWIDPANARSIRLAERLGFRKLAEPPVDGAERYLLRTSELSANR